MPRVVVTLPAYHAESTLAKTVADIPPGVADELILVDDASADNTAQLARDLGISVYVHPENRGYGGNQKTCYTKALESGADIVVMLHPDYQYEPKSVPLLIAPILAGEADMTFGSRFAGLGDPRGGGMPIYRFIGNRITTLIQNLILGSRFSEMHSGMRAYTRECLLSLPFLGYSEDFSFDAQFLVDAVTAGQRVVEVPIPTRYTKESSSIGILRSLKYVTTGIGYAAKVTMHRGRRGRRNPVVAGSSGHRLKPSNPPDVESLLDAADRFVLTGRKVMVVDAHGELPVVPLPSSWEAAEADGVVDIAVVTGALMAGDPHGVLGKLRHRLTADGVVTFGSAGSDFTTIHRHLSEDGFRMIEWGTTGGGLVIARHTD